MKIHWYIKEFAALSPVELYKIFHLRIEIFAVEQNCVYQDADGKDLYSFHVMGWNDQKELMTYARIVLPGISYKEVSIGRIVTSGKVRGTGAGKELMKKCFKFITEKYGNVPIRISAQSYLIKFYIDLGFAVQGKEYIEDHILHIEMLRGA